MELEQKLFKYLRVISILLTVIFIAFSYGGDPVAWAAAMGMSVASLMLLFVPEL